VLWTYTFFNPPSLQQGGGLAPAGAAGSCASPTSPWASAHVTQHHPTAPGPVAQIKSRLKESRKLAANLRSAAAEL